MSIEKLLAAKGYLFHSDQPGIFLRCADTILQYQTWNSTISPVEVETSAPFGLIYAKENTPQGAELFYNKMRKNWRDFHFLPEVLTLCTSECNLNCPYCLIGVQKGARYRYPSIAQLERAFQLFPVRNVELTGGEPLAEKGKVEQILEWLIGRVEKCVLITNGVGLDEAFWSILRRCSRHYDLRIRLTLSDELSHMSPAEFETQILPQARKSPDIKINLNFLPNHDGSGLTAFLRRVNELKLPPQITVAPICLLKSEFSGPVTFDMENYIKEILEVVEHEDEYLGRVNFFPEHDFGLLVHNPELVGCRRGKVTLCDQGYALCNMTLQEGNFLAGPIETAQSSWEILSKPCQGCEYYPDHCAEGIKSNQCFHFATGCLRCPTIYLCLLRCPYLLNANTADSTNLNCLGHALLRVFALWLTQRNRCWKDIRGETSAM